MKLKIANSKTVTEFTELETDLPYFAISTDMRWLMIKQLDKDSIHVFYITYDSDFLAWSMESFVHYQSDAFHGLESYRNCDKSEWQSAYKSLLDYIKQGEV
jgi:hypothetical protein